MYRKAISLIYQGPVEAAAMPLERDGRVEKAVAEDPRASREGRADNLINVLRSVGREQKELRPRGLLLSLPVEQQLSQLLSKRGSARFPGINYLPASCYEPLGKELVEGGLAATIYTFKSDEGGGAF